MVDFRTHGCDAKDESISFFVARTLLRAELHVGKERADPLHDVVRVGGNDVVVLQTSGSIRKG